MTDLFNDSFVLKVELELERLVLERMDKIALSAHNNLTLATPVDKGIARAGWNFSLNKIDTRIPKAPKISKKNKVVLQPQQSKPDAQARKIGDAYHLTNALPYMIPLNEGHSQQAPAKFVERSVAKAVKDSENY